MYRPLPPKEGNRFCIFRVRTSNPRSPALVRLIYHILDTRTTGEIQILGVRDSVRQVPPIQGLVFSVGAFLFRPRFSRVRGSSAWPWESATSGMPQGLQMKTNIFASETGWDMMTDSLANKQSRDSQEADDVSESPK